MTEKLRSKEGPTIGQDSGVVAEEVPAEPEVVKVEDHFSTGSGGSDVVDDLDGPQLVDSGDSYFPSDNYPPHHDEYAAAATAVAVDQSEEDDGSDDGQNHFTNPFASSADHQEDDSLGWWVWS